MVVLDFFSFIFGLWIGMGIMGCLLSIFIEELELKDLKDWRVLLGLILWLVCGIECLMYLVLKRWYEEKFLFTEVWFRVRGLYGRYLEAVEESKRVGGLLISIIAGLGLSNEVKIKRVDYWYDEMYDEMVIDIELEGNPLSCEQVVDMFFARYEKKDGIDVRFKYPEVGDGW